MALSALSDRIASEITNMISAGELAPQAHLNTQKLADHFQVSRSPVREALQLLAQRGFLELRENRGYFVGTKRIKVPRRAASGSVSDASPSYYQLAEDWLRDQVPAEVTEQFLRERYALTKAQVFEILNRATREGWMERKPGYGWRLLPVAKTPEAAEQIYRFRSVIEPAALLEATFDLDRNVIAAQRQKQQRLLDGDIEQLPAVRLLSAGVELHEEIIKLSRNPFFIQALERVNRLRRLIDYRAMIDRKRYYSQCAEHLAILDLIDRGDNVEASHLMRRHLSGVLELKSPFHRRPAR
jgi:DNA-binding GntR family transcriptional regulator